VLKRQPQAPPPASPNASGESLPDLIFQMREALRSGLRALEDPEVEVRVRDHFEKNPNFSRDPVHVAAVASQFAAEKAKRVNRNNLRHGADLGLGA